MRALLEKIPGIQEKVPVSGDEAESATHEINAREIARSTLAFVKSVSGILFQSEED